MTEPLIIQLQGEFDIYRSSELEGLLAPALTAQHLIIDFSGVRYVDSSALSALVRMRKRRTAAGLEPAVFVIGPPQVQIVLSLTRLDELWVQCETLEDAKAVIKGRTRQKK